MDLKSARSFLSVAFAFIIAMSLVVGVFSTISCFTIGSSDYYSKHLVTQELIDQCNDQLEKKFSALSKKSNIPLRVFESVFDQNTTIDELNNSVVNLFDENSPQPYNEVRVAYFYDMLKIYLDANEIYYRDEDLVAVSQESARIYSDVVCIHNMDYFNGYVSDSYFSSTRVVAVCISLIAFSTIAIMAMYKEREQTLVYVATGALGGGIATIISGFVGLAARFGYVSGIQPDVYNNAFNSIIRGFWIYSIAEGLLVLVMGIVLKHIAEYYINTSKSHRKNPLKNILRF